ncbi:MAG: hypothetical protein WBA12_10525, partial [Catalinimonas sp.]
MQRFDGSALAQPGKPANQQPGNQSFTKYHGTGNDFVMIDDRAGRVHPTAEQVAHLCHRRFGVGADGLILLRMHADFDFEMVYYNADGSGATFCGNGARCAVAFAAALGVFEGRARFLAADGPHEALLRDGLVHLRMGDVSRVERREDYTY